MSGWHHWRWSTYMRKRRQSKLAKSLTSSLWLDHTNLISCARLSCFCRVVYFFILKFSLVASCEFSIMSLASGASPPDSHRGSALDSHRGSAPGLPPGLRPGPRWRTSVPQTRCSPHPLYENPGSATAIISHPISFLYRVLWCIFILYVKVIPVTCLKILQEIWANAHETRDSISLISCAGCLGLPPVIAAQFTLKMCHSLKSRKNFTKNPTVEVQCRSRSSMLVPPERLSAVLVMISSNSVSICNRSHARRTSGKITIS